MNIFRAPIIAFAILLIRQAGTVDAQVGGGLGEQHPAEVDQKKSPNNHSHGRARTLDLARGGKTEGDAIAETSQRGLWSGGGSSYSKYSNKGCRNYHGHKGSSHYDYDLYTHHVSHNFCKQKCDGLGHHCYGYEYSSGRCEVWRVGIYHVEYVHGLTCYIRH